MPLIHRHLYPSPPSHQTLKVGWCSQTRWWKLPRKIPTSSSTARPSPVLYSTSFFLPHTFQPLHTVFLRGGERKREGRRRVLLMCVGVTSFPNQSPRKNLFASRLDEHARKKTGTTGFGLKRVQNFGVRSLMCGEAEHTAVVQKANTNTVVRELPRWRVPDCRFAAPRLIVSAFESFELGTPFPLSWLLLPCNRGCTGGPWH